MTIVMACWVLAMLSGLLGPRRWTSLLSLVTAAAFIATQAAALARPTGWLQLAVLGVTPWLLATARGRNEQAIAVLRTEKARQMARLSEAARALMSLKTETQSMEGHLAEIGEVYHVTKETSRALHLHELFAASLELVPRLLDARGLRLIDLSEGAPQIFRAVRTPDGRMNPLASNGSKASDHMGDGREMEEAIIRRMLAAAQAASATAQELSCALPEGVSHVAWAPLWREQKPIGVLIADHLPAPQLKTLAIVANQLSLQLSRIHLYQQVEALAVTDALTGLFVRSYFLERTREELARSIRHGLSCTLLMTDLDLFKQKNDTYGHLVGDVVLKDVAHLLQRNLREVDLIARFGGEEFILLLIETNVDQALPIAERLKQLVEVHPIRAYDELLNQTISIGMAGFPDHAKTLDALIERADQALYAAKRAGRNQVVRWSAAISREDQREVDS